MTPDYFRRKSTEWGISERLLIHLEIKRQAHYRPCLCILMPISDCVLPCPNWISHYLANSSLLSTSLLFCTVHFLCYHVIRSMSNSGNIAHYSGPDKDALFYACFECPYDDCHYDQSNLGGCSFRVQWGRKRRHEELGEIKKASTWWVAIRCETGVHVPCLAQLANVYLSLYKIR